MSIPQNQLEGPLEQSIISVMKDGRPKVIWTTTELLSAVTRAGKRPSSKTVLRSIKKLLNFDRLELVRRGSGSQPASFRLKRKEFRGETAKKS